MAMINYIVGSLEKIDFVVIFTRYEDKWVYCWHKKRESFEHPAGHVEANESPLQAAKRELYEETGIKDCDIIPLWDYEYIWEDDKGRNTGRVYLAIAHSLGSIPESEMDRIELFDNVPDNYTYNREEEIRDLLMVERIWKTYMD